MSRTPVIFVPGLMGSFNLPVLLDWRGPTLNGWDFPPFIDYGSRFLKAFQDSGYVRNQDLFVAFYDWRKSVRDSAVNYLKPWIDRAKKASGAKKVILIGHSMGGLVSRSYIQSAKYDNDVERLVTLATPHRGAGEAYYIWGNGEPRTADPKSQTVLNVYLWYLSHAHPFQTELNKVRTIRTQVPSIRDLLPIDSYLLNDGGPPTVPKEEDTLIERNLWSDLLNQPVGLDSLFGRVPVTTFSGKDVPTIRTITVGGPPLPPQSPPLFPDGSPVSEQTDTNGDGTVPLKSAQLADPRAKNFDPLGVSHSAVPDNDQILGLLFDELNIKRTVLGAAPEAAPVVTTRLVIMTASPVKLSVQTPGGPPIGVLGAAAEGAPARRPRRIRARDYGHSGKHLNMIVVDNPEAGSYQVRIEGTATGTFALGTMIIGAQTGAVLGAAGDSQVAEAQPAPTQINTVEGQVSAGSERFYEVICRDASTQPDIRLDVLSTGRNALQKLRTGVQAAGGAMLGASAESVDTVLGGVGDNITDLVTRALSGDEDALNQVVGLLGSDRAGAVKSALSAVAERVVGGADEDLAAAILEQLRALA